MKRLNGTLALIITLVLASGAAAAQASPTAFLKSNDKKLSPLLAKAEKNKKQIVKIVNKMLDFNILCRDSLGKHWDGHTDNERKKFIETLQALIEKNLINRLKNTRERLVTYESEEIQGEKASVVTLITTGNALRAEKTEIEYKLRKRGSSWGVVDMVTDGISLVSNYRSQFNKIITNDGWDVLMKKMKDKLAE